jgi:predicted house-cleaning noncanonical NTP pyrophosphatase (MazG superfamily)
MAEFNSCAHLLDNIDEATKKYNEIKLAGGSPLNEMLKMQNQLQVNLKEKLGRTIPPDELKTKGELVDFLFDQKRASDDEFMELIHSCAGSNKSDKEQTSIWKKWKSDYTQLRSEDINEGLTEEEVHEKNFELCDLTHFFLNMILALGLTEKELFEYYYMKNKENFNRYQNGY